MSLPVINLRPEKSSDESFLRKLFATTRVDVTFSGLPEEQKQEFLRMQFDAQKLHYRTKYNNTQFMVIMHEDTRIGRLYLSTMPEELRVMDITLMPSWRGKGLGSELLRMVQDQAKSVGLNVTLHAEKLGNMAAYYQRLGFEVTSEIETHHFMTWHHKSAIITP